MATFAARKALDIANNTRRIVGIELLAACQGIEFLRPLRSSPKLEAAHRLLRQWVPSYDEDRYLAPDLDAVEALIANGELDAFLAASLLGEK